MDSPVQNLALCLHRRRRADEGLSQNRAASSPHMFTQLAGVWAGPICRETVALECLHLTREGTCTWLGESQGPRALLCPLGREPYLKAECLRGPPDLTLPKLLVHLPDTSEPTSLYQTLEKFVFQQCEMALKNKPPGMEKRQCMCTVISTMK